MPSPINAPQKSLSKDAFKVQLITQGITAVIGLVILVVLYYLDNRFLWKEWIGWSLHGLLVIGVIATIWSFVEPYFLYKSWRYDIDEDFLQMKFGVIIERHFLVPMTKIQAVSTKQGPILRRYGLYTISIKTMGSSHEIPGLPGDVASQLREQIAHYAKLKEVE
ncbi:PH domain-containing protein [Brevibacillus sp. BC25]|uniref:PH domain-containing protein n=1 Tax=Brevibacillus sp. BC25 TaxID=1144308 RepID=UPI000270FCAF|nr:PH domain-containing protein [Brevibacillus sp. BC25]EJL22551.1 hypothetical protein PMI05_05006 [Brevibacillus sp. BC25]